ncbi:MAG: Ku protein [Acetobacteraceae bacterium]
MLQTGRGAALAGTSEKETRDGTAADLARAFTAHHDRGDLHFHLINPATGHRIRSITQDAETEEPVSRRDLVKGYEFKPDHYLIMTNEDFDNARIESSSTLNIEKFLSGDSIDPVHYDASYYVAPDGEAGKDVYVVLRDAIERTGRIALSRVVIADRERAIASCRWRAGWWRIR